jgi:hypothetical protein
LLTVILALRLLLLGRVLVLCESIEEPAARQGGSLLRGRRARRLYVC